MSILKKPVKKPIKKPKPVKKPIPKPPSPIEHETFGGPIYVEEIPPPESTKEERIQFIMKLMTDQRWITGVTYKWIASKCFWNVGPAAVRSYSCEASRRVRHAYADVETIERATSIALMKIIQAQKAGDNRNVIQASKVINEIFGATAQARQELQNVQMLGRMTDEQLSELVKDAAKLVKEKVKEKEKSKPKNDDKINPPEEK